MKLSEVKIHLKDLSQIAFQLPNGVMVSNHFHVTEVGKITKHYFDCGGVVREEEVVNFQLCEANDYNHRLQPEKLLTIIERAEKKLQIPVLDLECQMKEPIEKFDLYFDGINFQLKSRITHCLAKDNCGIPLEKLKTKIGEWNPKEISCLPNSVCC